MLTAVPVTVEPSLSVPVSALTVPLLLNTMETVAIASPALFLKVPSLLNVLKAPPPCVNNKSVCTSKSLVGALWMAAPL